METIKKRLKVFESLNISVVEYYSSRGKVHKVSKQFCFAHNYLSRTNFVSFRYIVLLTFAAKLNDKASCLTSYYKTSTCIPELV